MRTPAQELVIQLRLERKLVTRLRKLFAEMAQSIEASLGPIGGSSLPNLRAEWDKALADVLLEHYALVVRVIGGDISRALPRRLQPGSVERQVFAVVISRIFVARAHAQAVKILETAQRRAQRAMAQAINAETGPQTQTTTTARARLTARIWFRMAGLHALSIATMETQAAVETTKGVEVSQLLGHGTPVTKGAGDAEKTWVTQGDSRVRTARGSSPYDHLEADGQKVGIESAFIVSGERLLWPGDWSQGATGGNIYGCRCSALYDVEGISVLRGMFHQTILQDVERFTQTESDVIVSLPFQLR